MRQTKRRKVIEVPILPPVTGEEVQNDGREPGPAASAVVPPVPPQLHPHATQMAGHVCVFSTGQSMLASFLSPFLSQQLPPDSLGHRRPASVCSQGSSLGGSPAHKMHPSQTRHSPKTLLRADPVPKRNHSQPAWGPTGHSSSQPHFPVLCPSELPDQQTRHLHPLVTAHLFPLLQALFHGVSPLLPA